MKYIDLSHTLSPGIPAYPGDQPFTSHLTRTITSDGYNLHTFSLTSHTGTHLDAPYHFFELGKTVNRIPLEWLVGRPVVVDLLGMEDRQEITWDALKAHEGEMVERSRRAGGGILLIRTGWSAHWCTPRYNDHPFLSRGAAVEILKRGIRIIGVDTLSPDETATSEAETKGGFGVHEEVLGMGGVFVENLTNLGELIGGEYTVSLVPLSIEGCDGAPVRAFAWREV